MLDALLKPRSLRRGFTLLELITTVTIIAILLALVLPTFSRVKAETRAGVAKQTLQAVLRDANTLAGFESRPVTFGDISAAAAEAVRGALPYSAVIDDGTTGTRAGLSRISVRENEEGWGAALAFDGGCAYASTSPAGNTIPAWHVLETSTCSPTGTGNGGDSDDGTGVVAPSTPRNVNVTALTIVSVRVAFAAPSSDGGAAVAEYRIIAYTGGAAVATTTVPVADLTTAAGGYQFEMASLTPGTRYTFSVEAHNAAGFSEPASSSAVWTFGPPAQVTGLAGSIADGSVTLTWDIPQIATHTPVTGYRVYLNNGGDWNEGDWNELATVEAPTVTVDQLQNGTAYTFRVAAYGTGGNGEPSGQITFTPLDVPAAPTTVSAVAGSGEVTLSWSEVTGMPTAPLSGYRIYRFSQVSGVFELVGSTVSRTFTQDGLANGTEYRYKLAAYGDGGEGLRSDEVRATPVTAPAPVAIGSLSYGNRTVTVPWEAVSTPSAPVTAFDVYLDGELVEAGLAPSVAIYGFTELAAGQSYAFSIRARNSVGSATASIDGTAVTVPAVPQGLIATADDAAVELSWDAVSATSQQPISGYRIYRLNAVSSVYELVGASVTASFTDEPLTNGVAVTYKVAAYGTGGEGLRTASLSVTPYGVPAAITGLIATTGDRSITVSFDDALSTAAAPVTAIELLRDGDVVATLGPDATSYTFTDRTAGTVYLVGARTKNLVHRSALTSMAVTAIQLPSAPASLTATARDAEVVLDWESVASTGSTPVSGYRIYQLDPVDDSYALVGSTATTAYVIADLTNGTEYTFKVAAYGSAGEGARSTTASATPITVPAAISFATSTLENGAVTVNWSSSPSSAAPIDSFTVKRGSTTVATGVAANLTSYRFSGLAAGLQYNFEVIAVNDAGSTSASITETAYAVPAAPQNLTAVPGDASVTLSWSPVDSSASAPVAGYRIYLDVDGVPTLVGATAQTTHPVSGLINGTASTFRVTAYGNAGESSRTSVTATPIGAPGAVTFTTPSLTDRAITVNWDATSTAANPVTGFDVYQGATPVATGLAASTRQFAFSGLTAGTSYTFKVVSKNSLFTTDASTTAIAVTFPAAPTNLAATTADSSSTLTWTTVASTSSAPVTGYRIYQLDPKAAAELIGSTASLGFIVTGLTNGGYFDFEVAAYGPAGEGARASVGVTPMTTPGATTITSLTATGTSVAAGWSAVSSTGGAPEISYTVELWVYGGSRVSSVSKTTRTHTFTGLPTGTRYTARVKAVNEIGSGSFSAYAGDTTTIPAAPSITGLSTSALTATPTWSASAGATQYSVELWTYGGSLYNSATSASTSYTFTGLPGSTRWTARVSAYNAAGWSATSSFSGDAYTGCAGGSVTFSYTGSVQYWAVPVNCTLTAIDAYGAAGGSASGLSGGNGGRIYSSYSYPAGTPIGVMVGGSGTPGCGWFDGGCRGNLPAGGGGGSSSVWVGSTALVIAGGGGGAGTTGNGGSGGGDGCGLNGSDGSNSGLYGRGGCPTWAGSPGAPGNGHPDTASGTGTCIAPSSGRTGGNGFSYSPYTIAGGGGGGGRCGGGGGSATALYAGGGGGGGGERGGVFGTLLANQSGVRAGNGVVVVYFG
jgi:prepilin-type N-terminal cleavage/methylation domain-containing protein